MYIRVCILYILIYICHNNMYMYLCMHVCRLFFIFRCRLFFNIYLTYCLWSFVAWRFYVIYVVMCVDYYYYFLYSFAILWVIFVRWLLYVSTCMYTCVWIIFFNIHYHILRYHLLDDICMHLCLHVNVESSHKALGFLCIGCILSAE